MRRIGLGTVQFGLDYGVANNSGKVPVGEAKKIVDDAIKVGIDTFDTAISYGDSERVLGAIGVRNVKVVTKLPNVPENTLNVADWVNNQINQSLVRLNIDSVYGVLLHRSESLIGPNGDEVANSLQLLKERGLAQKIGVSIYDPEELTWVTDKVNLDIVQAPLSLIDRRLVDSGWLGRLCSKGIEVHTRSAFLQGLLLMPRLQIPPYFERWSSIWDNWHRTLQERQLSPVEACLNYPLSLASVDRVIVGVDSASQLRVISQASEFANCSADWSFMRSEEADLINPGRWG